MIQYSEVFRSIQGEGPYTGRPTIWVRFFTCNLQCDGFGQEDPMDPSTYDLPYQKIDVTDITRLEDLPVFEKGCDSSYSWSKKFKHLQHNCTAEELVDQLEAMLPNGAWKGWGLCFTGGEPLLKRNQKQVIEIISEIDRRSKINSPDYLTFETNGTQPLTAELNRAISEFPIVMSISPKLQSVSGELPSKAIKIDVLADHLNSYDITYLKFVCDDSDQCWSEMNAIIDALRPYLTWHPNINEEIWVMPVGATKEGQEDIAARVADRALDHGYNVSARVHTYIWGNQIGT